MANLSLKQLQSSNSQEYQSDPSKPLYTKYVVQGVEYHVPPWSHPASIANRILSEIQHTFYYGIQVVAPPGNGKTTIAKIIAHHLHKRASADYSIDFDVKVEDEKVTHAFENLDNYIRTLPKKPVIVIFDDLSGVFGRMSEEQIEKNFETLTRVRWILDPSAGHIPFIPILTYHYSKVVEKKFRSQNGMSIFCRFGNEEKTNIDTIAPKRTQARRALLNFQRILKTMFVKHHFSLMFEDGAETKFETDNPFRACCMVSDDVGNVIVSSKYDICSKCDVQSKKRKVDPLEAIKRLYEIHGHYGIQQLRQSLANRGVTDAIHPKAYNAMNFIENRWLPSFEYDLYELRDAIYKMYKTGRPKRANRKVKQENEAMKLLDEIAFMEKDENS